MLPTKIFLQQNDGEGPGTEPCTWSHCYAKASFIQLSVTMQRLHEGLMLLTGCATVQIVGRQPFAMETWVQPKASQRGISIGPSGSGAGFSLSTHVSPVSIAPHCSILNHSCVTDAI